MLEPIFFIAKQFITFSITHLWLPLPVQADCKITAPSLLEPSGTSMARSENTDRKMQQPAKSLLISTASILQLVIKRVRSYFLAKSFLLTELKHR